jgi:SP family sugar:H+ symporter-like MFS transporter
MGAKEEQQEPPSGFVILISVVAALGGFLFGFDSGVINGTVEALQNAFQSGSVGTGFSVASMLLGCAAGSFVAGGMADRFGRKPVMIVTAVAFFISAWGSGIASSTTEFVFYRLLGGLAVGAASVIAPAYIAEVSPAAYRGRLASLQQLAIVIGLFTSFLSNYLIVLAAGTPESPFLLGFAAWKWMFWVEMIPALLFGLGACLAPESPRYLMARGHHAAAEAVFRKIQNSNCVTRRIAEVMASLKGEQKPRFSDVLLPGTAQIRPIVWAGIGLSSFQQLVGINVIFYYGAVLWRAAGFSHDMALLTNVISGAVNISATFVAIALVDRIGRKPLLLAGSAGMTLMLALVAYVFGTAGLDANGDLQLTRFTSLLALVGVHLYIFSFAVSWGPVVWVMLGEMFSNRFRGAALGIAASAQWLTNFAITMTFPILLTSIGLGGAYAIYAAFSLISLAFVYYRLRETKGIELEDM